MRGANPACGSSSSATVPLRPALQAAHPECIFTGFIPRDDLARHYASADVYVHASLTERSATCSLRRWPAASPS